MVNRTTICVYSLFPEEQYNGLDGSKIEDPDYCEWVISVCNNESDAESEEQTEN